jgi:hypothetical protein
MSMADRGRENTQVLIHTYALGAHGMQPMEDDN